MPNPVVGLTVASAGTGIYGANQASAASDRAIQAAREGTDATIAESARQFDTVREDTRIARETGDSALMTLGFLLGVRQPPSVEDITALETQLSEAQALRDRSASAKGGATPAPGGWSLSTARTGQPGGGVTAAKPVDIGAIDSNIQDIQKRLDQAKRMQQISTQYPGGIGDFIKSQPGYDFGLQEGNRALVNTLSAKGQGQGGKAMKAAERYGIDYAGSKTDEHLSRLFTLAGYGPAGVNTSAAAGQNHANTVGAANTALSGAIGDSAYNNAAANITGVNNAVNTGISLWTYNDYMNRTQPGAG